MNQVKWIGALCAIAMLSAGVTAWASASEQAWAPGASVFVAGQDLQGVSAPPGYIGNRTEHLLAGQDTSGVSAPPV